MTLPLLVPSLACGDQGEMLVRGSAVFHQRCAVCHGHNADGDSALARLMTPQPANLRRSRLSRSEREDIVRKGGAAVGRSGRMPAWQNELSAAQIGAVVAYVGSLREIKESDQ